MKEKAASCTCNHQFPEPIRKEVSAGFTYNMTKLWCELKYEYNKKGLMKKQGECDFKENEKNCPLFVERF